MKTLLKAFFTKPLVIYLSLSLIAISTIAGPAEAMFLPSTGEAAGLHTAADRAGELQRLQTALESRSIRQRLADYGLTPEEAASKLSGLSDSQVHQLAADLNSVQAGGDVIIDLVFIALLAVLLIFLLEGRIQIKRR